MLRRALPVWRIECDNSIDGQGHVVWQQKCRPSDEAAHRMAYKDNTRSPSVPSLDMGEYFSDAIVNKFRLPPQEITIEG